MTRLYNLATIIVFFSRPIPSWINDNKSRSRAIEYIIFFEQLMADNSLYFDALVLMVYLYDQNKSNMKEIESKHLNKLERHIKRIRKKLLVLRSQFSHQSKNSIKLLNPFICTIPILTYKSNHMIAEPLYSYYSLFNVNDFRCFNDQDMEDVNNIANLIFKEDIFKRDPMYKNINWRAYQQHISYFIGSFSFVKKLSYHIHSLSIYDLSREFYNYQALYSKYANHLHILTNSGFSLNDVLVWFNNDYSIIRTLPISYLEKSFNINLFQNISNQGSLYINEFFQRANQTFKSEVLKKYSWLVTILLSKEFVGGYVTLMKLFDYYNLHFIKNNFNNLWSSVVGKDICIYDDSYKVLSGYFKRRILIENQSKSYHPPSTSPQHLRNVR